ncbi:DUF3995 domain-containing protein [Terrabacter sp. NPDC000476]|uniref:DUF3995 domain-containing protein n=1 Tax=Terrabacter sp. NPDC000476 TaxID=3154258 RepID=UPI0033300088
MDRPDATGERFLLAAAVVALAHALPSLYWAFGGTLGTDSLGSWAPAWRADSPVLVGAVLVGVFVAKALGGVVPVLATRGRLPRPRVWRALSWAGAAVLVLYGAANVVVGGLALLGVVEGPTDPAARAALAGHVLLWDPLFLVWGLLLAAGLARTRRTGRDRARPVLHGT